MMYFVSDPYMDCWNLYRITWKSPATYIAIWLTRIEQLSRDSAFSVSIFVRCLPHLGPLHQWDFLIMMVDHLWETTRGTHSDRNSPHSVGHYPSDANASHHPPNLDLCMSSSDQAACLYVAYETQGQESSVKFADPNCFTTSSILVDWLKSDPSCLLSSGSC